ncbi:hypothetical protein GCM10027066_03430 [Dyella jejuensis]
MLLQQAALHQQVKRIRLAGQALADQRVGLRVLRHAADGSQALEKIIEEKLFLGCHGDSVKLLVDAGTLRA